MNRENIISIFLMFLILAGQLLVLTNYILGGIIGVEKYLGYNTIYLMVIFIAYNSYSISKILLDKNNLRVFIYTVFVLLLFIVLLMYIMILFGEEDPGRFVRFNFSPTFFYLTLLLSFLSGWMKKVECNVSCWSVMLLFFSSFMIGLCLYFIKLMFKLNGLALNFLFQYFITLLCLILPVNCIFVLINVGVLKRQARG
ncbi:hypothetical protein [Aliikangiella maris]|uniref:Uncharacterized protein n=2 Tax=Aliikangiella maris TaxID=3162458 RepID=A0ABV2BZZ3_9GAMM